MLKRFAVAVLMLSGVAVLSGCDNFERNTFQTLSSSKAVIDGAQADYENGALPHSKCVYTVITDAKTADKVAVDAMVSYEQVKAANGNVGAAEGVVVADLANLVPLVAQIQALKTNPNCGGK